MAAEADVGERTIRRAKVAESAGLGDAVRDGKVSVKRAAEIVKADPTVAKKIAAGKVTPDQVIEKAAKQKAAAEKPAPLPKILPRPEAATKPKPAPAPVAPTCAACADHERTIAELREQLAEQDDQLEGLLKQIDGPDAAAKEIERLKGQVRTVKASRDAEMTKCTELVREVGRLKRQITRLEKAAKPKA